MSRGRPLRRVLRAVAAGLFGLNVVAAVGWGVWQWRLHHRAQPPPAAETPFRGVAYRRAVTKTPRPNVVHVVRIDLRTPGLRFRVTPGDGRRDLPLVGKETTAFLAETGAQLAVNGDFFYPWRSNAPWDYYPHRGDPVTTEGHACSDGDCYVRAADKARFPCLSITRDNRAAITPAAPTDAARRWNVLSGNRLLLENGRDVSHAGADLHPRTAVGLDAARRFLVLAVVDGRQPKHSEGMTERELAALLRAEGCRDALNLDGGGSTALAIRRGAGGPELLNCPIDNRIPGRERNVANHLAVWAPPP